MPGKSGTDEDVLIDYLDNDVQYRLSKKDFKKVEEYCENECMGIKFLINANQLREIIKVLIESGSEPPFTNKDFEAEEFRQALLETTVLESIEKRYGTDDIRLVMKIIIKSTYNFLNKV